jgi:hypothetical protein
VAENAGVKKVYVTLSGPASEDVIVNYETNPGTALAGVNYTATSSSVTFPAGSTTSQEIPVAILDDVIYGGDTFFFVNLTSVSSGNADIGSPDATQITVEEDEITYTLNLPAGQSIISFPIVVEPFLASSLGQYGITSVVRYDSSTSAYKPYLIGVSPKSQDFTMMTDYGYIVYCSEPTSIVLAGKPAVNREITLSSGQTIIGWSTLSTSDSVVFTNALSGVQSITKFDNPASKYVPYLEGISPLTSPYRFALQPGEGYIVFTDTPVTINYGGI